MNNFNNCCEKFNITLDTIDKYCDILIMQKDIISTIENTENIETNNSITNYLSKIKNIISSPIQYNAVIISIYGCFELFIEQILKEYILFICKNTDKYENLPQSLIKKHQTKVGEFLQNNGRFKHLNLEIEEVIQNFNSLIKCKNKIELNKNIDFLTLHGQGGNLNSQQLFSIFKELGIEDSNIKIGKNIAIKEFFSDSEDPELDKLYNEKKNNNQLFENLDYLLEKRNIVAHSWVSEERESYEIIKIKYIKFLKALSKSIKELLVDESIKYMIEQNKLIKTPLKKIKVIDSCILCINNEKNFFKKNDYILVEKPNSENIVLFINTLQINHQEIDQVNEENLEIGIGFEKREDRKIKENYNFFILKNSKK